MTSPSVIPHIDLSRSGRGVASALLCGSLLCVADLAQAQGFSSPDECRDSTGDAHVTCLYSYIETQQKRLAQMEDELHRQAAIVNRVEEQFDRQVALGQEIPSSIIEPAAVPAYIYPHSTPGYAYAGYGYPGVPYGYPAYGTGLGLSLYPGLGFALGFGGRGYYSRPFYAPRYLYRAPGFYGPRFSYGRRFYSGPRFPAGPRSYSGSRSFGPRSFGSRSFGRGRR